MYFNYDGLNRQVSRTVGGVTTYNVWDGWDLIEEYQSGGTVDGKICIWRRRTDQRSWSTIDTITKTAAAAHRMSLMAAVN